MLMQTLFLRKNFLFTLHFGYVNRNSVFPVPTHSRFFSSHLHNKHYALQLFISLDQLHDTTTALT